MSELLAFESEKERAIARERLLSGRHLLMQARIAIKPTREGIVRWDLLWDLLGQLEHQIADAPIRERNPEAVYYTVSIPYSTDPTPWHPTERTGPLSVLTRGAFDTSRQAHTWARDHLAGQPYSVKPISK